MLARTRFLLKMAVYDSGNIFAKIIDGTIPSYKVFETPTVLAFLDAFPQAVGHCLLVPKAKKYVTIDQMPADEAADLLQHLPALSAAIRAATNAEGLTVLQNNNPAGGQEVPHVHFHVVPRFEGVPRSGPSSTMITPEDASAILIKLKENLPAHLQ